MVKYDSQAGAYTDGTNYVKGSLIRKFTNENSIKAAGRGRIAKFEIRAYWLDKFKEEVNVA